MAMQLDPKDPNWVEADAIRQAAERGAGLTKRLLSFSRAKQTTATIINLVAVAETWNRCCAGSC